MTHRIDLPLASGAGLRLILDGEEHRWVFSYDYRKSPKEDPHHVVLVCKVRLVVDYRLGEVGDKVSLSMEVIAPENLGKEFLYGMDVSPGGKIYVEFTYEKQADRSFRLVEGQIGARRRQRFDGGEGLVKPVDLPFPVPDRVALEHGWYRFPFLAEGDEIRAFEFPARTVDR